MLLQTAYEREGVHYVEVLFYMPFINYGNRKPSTEERIADQEKGYLTPFKTVWVINKGEQRQEVVARAILSSFKPRYLQGQRGRFMIPQTVTGERHARDVVAQLKTVAEDWVARGHDVDLSG